MQLAATVESANYIVYAETVNIQIDRLERHPANRPLGLDREKIDQLKALISQYGYQASQPLIVRALDDKYQIIQGEHRYIACVELGFTEIPCVVQEMDDTEALIQLIVGNVQTENRPLEIGLNALEVVQKDSKKGLSAQSYADRIGINGQTLRRYFNAAITYNEIEQFSTGGELLQDITKLLEINTCPESDWFWLHDFIIASDLSKNDTITVCKAVRDLSDSIKLNIIPELLDIDSIKKVVAKEVLEGKTKALGTAKGVISEIQDCYGNLDHTVFYSYTITSDEITEQNVDLQKMFADLLKSKGKLDKAIVSSAMKSTLDKKQQHTKESAETAAAYYRSEKNHKEIEEHRRIDKEQSEYAFNAWLACESIESIAGHLSVSIEEANRMIMGQKLLVEQSVPESLQVFNIWNFQSPDSRFGIDYPGRIPGQIVENVLHYYTEPFDVVVDPMGGGGTTIDVCKLMHRRYRVYDIKPIRDDISQRDMSNGFPNECRDCDLIFMDPPYWNQKKGEYSDHEKNLANMDITNFYSVMEGIFESASRVLKLGGHIAVIIGPTQENMTIFDHAHTLYNLLERRFTFVNRIIVPYTTQQAQAYHVAEAKDGRYMLKLYRDLVVFKLVTCPAQPTGLAKT